MTVKPHCISGEILDWLRGKLADAEQALRIWEAMANLPTISDEEWERIKDLAEEPLRHKRIAEKCRCEVEMFRATIAALTK